LEAEVPKSRVRQKETTYAPPQQKAARKTSGPWVPYAFVGAMLLGLGWIVAYYASNQSFMSVLGGWNLVLGFVLIIVGLGIMTQWR
jgi:sulfite exporter TauE/SafE